MCVSWAAETRPSDETHQDGYETVDLPRGRQKKQISTSRKKVPEGLGTDPWIGIFEPSEGAFDAYREASKD
jgi:hypothetical protein